MDDGHVLGHEGVSGECPGLVQMREPLAAGRIEAAEAKSVKPAVARRHTRRHRDIDSLQDDFAGLPLAGRIGILLDLAPAIAVQVLQVGKGGVGCVIAWGGRHRPGQHQRQTFPGRGRFGVRAIQGDEPAKAGRFARGPKRRPLADAVDAEELLSIPGRHDLRRPAGFQVGQRPLRRGTVGRIEVEGRSCGREDQRVAARQPLDAVVVLAQEGHRRVAVVDRGDVDGRPLPGRYACQRFVQIDRRGRQIAVIDEAQLRVAGPAVEIEILGVAAAAEQDEQQNGLHGAGQWRPPETPLDIAQQRDQPDRRQEEDERDQADGPQIAGHDLADGQRRGQDHHQRGQQEQQHGRPLPIVGQAAIAPQTQQPAYQKQTAGHEVEDRPAGKVEAQVGVALQEKHAQRAPQALAERQAFRAGGNLSDAHPEGIGVQVEIDQQRQRGQKGHQGHPGDLP